MQKGIIIITFDLLQSQYDSRERIIGGCD